MASITFALPPKRIDESYILRILQDGRCPVRIVEVRVYEKGVMFGPRVPVSNRRFEVGNDLTEAAKDISKYIVDSGSIEVTVVASDQG